MSGLMSETIPERRLALIHRVIVPAKDSPTEFGILVTDRRSIFIRQEKTRSNFTLRGEIRYGTALITDVPPKTLSDYEQSTTASLSNNSENISVPHRQVISLELKKDSRKPGLFDFFVRLTMRMQKEEFQVYNFEMNYSVAQGQLNIIKFYMVPLGAYFKPKRQIQTRETILREYALENLEIFKQVLPSKIRR